MTQINRRTILGAMASAAAPVKIAAAEVATSSTLDDRLAAAKGEIIACLTERYGVAPEDVGSERGVFVFVPYPPESVEYDRPGFYKVEGKRPDGRAWCTTLWLERVDYKTVPGFYYRAESRWKGRVERTIRLKPDKIRIIRRHDDYPNA
ncbi:hypothetical protein [Sinorhizobium meliloti]|uniref:hypothetical protein n=1 Tax=Rhizobium meliloti TaxID=382 RepID=UPI000FDC3F79|nr:hypothetical protein [Sinorhizobium meliloti]MDW9358922.1 hypothetical protein [Sinorhizobium meliloti]MDW9486486.1 hypothetical protein [Sinorhizobium meliloti]MDW9590558.1 hypothetical protein [Sinorhizobium meliloti]MDW9606962.1 hypothetical protein [Sinorhizobium meliloti]MDW9658315.1 hypothetical protein [Sinorhizobium meliloti]